MDETPDEQQAQLDTVQLPDVAPVSTDPAPVAPPAEEETPAEEADAPAQHVDQYAIYDETHERFLDGQWDNYGDAAAALDELLAQGQGPQLSVEPV